MRLHLITLIGYLSSLIVGSPVTYWVHDSCHDPRFNGVFELGLKDATFLARRALARVDNQFSPYIDQLFEVMFRKPRTDVATLNQVKRVYDTIGNQLQQIEDQHKSDIRYYCDDDEFGPGRRWTLTPNDPDDPQYAKNDQLPRLLPKGAEKDKYVALQQWQDESNWIRMTRNSMGCQERSTHGETFYQTFVAEGTPNDINPNRVSMTICSERMTHTDLHPNVEVHTLSTTQKIIVDDLSSQKPVIEEIMGVYSFIASITILHELMHMHPNNIGFNAQDHDYRWRIMIALTPEEAIENAETYVAFAFLARVADKGYRLKMDDVSKGTVIYDENLERVGGEDTTPF